MWWNRLKDRQQLGLILLAIGIIAAVVAALLHNAPLAAFAAGITLFGAMLCVG